jgi:alanine dehydrogenase
VLVSEEMIKTMKPGSVVIDVAIDQGGSIATIDHVTTHTSPIYIKHGILHYSVANMPGAAPRTSTFALTNATLDYLLMITHKGWRQACQDDSGLARGVNMVEGNITCQGVAEAHGLPFKDITSYLERKNLVSTS